MRPLSLFQFMLLLLLVSCQRNAKQPVAEGAEIDYLQTGREIASSTFAAVSTRLQKAMQEGGVAQAIDYCNLNALPIFDSLSVEHGAEIKRTSFQLRNPRNLPTVGERATLKKYQDIIDAGGTPEAEVAQDEAGRPVFYSPILTQPLCLKCHGVIGQDIDDSDYQVIQTRYPNDKATGYALGQLRGIWSITFPYPSQQ